MIYVNTHADVHLPSQSGKSNVKIPAGTPAARPARETWLTNVGMVRSYVGVSLLVDPADPIVVDLGAQVTQDGYEADATDATNHGTPVSNGTSYTAFGKITWTDANGTWTSNFSVEGDGVEGSGATFVFDNVDDADTQPIATGSAAHAAQGKLSVAFDSGAPEEVGAVVFFEPVFVSPSVYFTETDTLLGGAPEVRTRMILVEDADVGDDYVSGSEGSVKIIREFAVGARVGDPCKVTTMKYTNETYPTKFTDVTVRYDLVLEEDLP